MIPYSCQCAATATGVSWCICLLLQGVCDEVRLHSYFTQVLDLKNKTVQFQDPLGSYTSVLPKALISLITSRLKSTMTEWKSIKQPRAMPLQNNGYDCGAFICVVCHAHTCKRHTLTVVLCCVSKLADVPICQRDMTLDNKLSCSMHCSRHLNVQSTRLSK